MGIKYYVNGVQREMTPDQEAAYLEQLAIESARATQEAEAFAVKKVKIEEDKVKLEQKIGMTAAELKAVLESL